MAGSLHKAKKVKNDEFYTRYKDIAEEMGIIGNILEIKLSTVIVMTQHNQIFGVIFIIILLVLVLKN